MIRAGSLRYRRLVAIAALAALFVTDIPSPAPASAQNLLEALFGGFRRAMTPQRRAYVDPHRTAEGAVSSGYCVRTCDGRYFPVSGRGRMNAAEMCRAFCPSAPTPIFSGGGIDREKMVPDCSCDGKSPLGLVRFDDADDPTLRTGDIVATANGLMTYRNDGRSGEFSPANAAPGLSPSLRQQLTATRVAPARGGDAQ